MQSEAGALALCYKTISFVASIRAIQSLLGTTRQGERLTHPLAAFGDIGSVPSSRARCSECA
jgi:hypothetical protein